jgi:hypothetical protein
VDANGQLKVLISQPSPDTIVDDYLLSSVANGTPANHDKTITSGKTATQIQAQVSSQGLIRWDLGTWDGTTFTAIITKYTEPASPSIVLSLQPFHGIVGTGTLKIRLVQTNDELTTQDCYSTLQWLES